VRLYNEVWRKARRATFTPEVLATPLASTPYHLRHAWISTLLTLAVAPAQVAEWAGNSVEVIYKNYAKVIDCGEAAALQRLSEGLR